MKKVIIGLILFSGWTVSAQTETPVSVFDCSTYDPPTEQEVITFPNGVFTRGCVDLTDPGNYNFNSTTYAPYLVGNIQVKSPTYIHANETCHIGPFLGNNSMHWSIDQVATISPIDVAVMNYDDLNKIAKWKKLELGVQIPSIMNTWIKNFILKIPSSVQLNPFVDWDTDVEAVFTYIEGNYSKTIDAFYFENYQHNSNDDWNAIGAAGYPFRLRFSPPQTGEWSCVINIKIHGIVTYSSNPFTFNVVDTGAHGYVKVHDNKRNLELDGKIIMPIGQNFPYPMIGANTYGVDPSKTNKAAPPSAWNIYHQQLHDYHDLGGRYVRISQGASSSLIEFEEKGNYYNRLHYAWETDRYIQYCDDNDMLLNFNLLFQEPLMERGQYGMEIWDFSHYKDPGDGHPVFNPSDTYPTYCYNDNPWVEGGELPSNMFQDDEDLKYHEQRMRYYIARYGYSTSIMQFELLSEPFHLNQRYPEGSFELENSPAGELVRTAVDNYTTRISNYTKNILNHKEHLIGAHAFGNSVKEKHDYDDYSIDLNTIDVIGFSTYAELPDKYLNYKDHDDIFDFDEKSFYKSTKYFTDTYHKPVMHFEEGALFTRNNGLYPDDCSNLSVHKINTAAIGFTGNTGFFAWQGDLSGENDRWPITIRAEKWMNSDAVINVLQAYDGQWFQGRQIANIHEGPLWLHKKENVKENQYYVDLAQENAVGFVYNRTFNYRTQSTSLFGFCNGWPSDFNAYPNFDEAINVPWTEGPNLVVQGLQANSDYSVKWYDYSGNFISQDCYSTGLNDKLVLKHPELTIMIYEPERPLIWYVIKKQNCQSGMIQNNHMDERANSINSVSKTISESEGQATELNISPNPFLKDLEIQVEEDAQFEIYSGSFEKVYSGRVSSGKNQLNLEFLSRGVYFLKLSTSDKVYKIVKM
nr:T9SS type A sorting domain-containing protein [uncultured Fluviicola sp.]